jgi:broad specificity phosphatase PhoE
MLARRMRSATGKRKTTGETMHDASPSDDLPGQMLPPPHSELPEVNLTPGPRTPYPRKTNLQVDLSCLTAFDGGPVSPGEEGGSQFVPSPTAMPSTCSSDAERVATPTSVSSAAPPVYPIFKAQTKTVYLIRHGESEYNAADAYYSKSFEEPFIFDAPLTYKGTMQVRPTTASHSAAFAIPTMNSLSASWSCQPHCDGDLTHHARSGLSYTVVYSRLRRLASHRELRSFVGGVNSDGCRAHIAGRDIAQARGLGPALRALPVNDIVWVTSPLTRAMQTCLLAMEASGRMPLAAADGGARAASCAPSAGTAQTQSGGEVRVGPITRQHTREQRPGATVHVLKDLAEHLATSGDVGRPRSTLQAAVPALATQLAALPHEEWWWAPAKNDHVTQRFGSREPKGAFRKRVGEFRQWVLSRPESNIVVFGHSTFFKELQGGHARRLANCELMKIRI